MALIVEDGSGVEGANSFVSTEELIAYAAARGVELNDEEADKFGFDAMDFLWTQCFGGEQLFELPFPRTGLVLPNGADLPSDIVPDAIKRAQAQLALDAKRGIKLTASSNPEQALKRRKVGPIEREFFAPGEGGVPANVPTLPVAMALLNAYLCGSAPLRIRTYRV